jgi:hypothetical protein
MSERSELKLVNRERSQKPKPSRSLIRRVISTIVALMVLAMVLRYLPPGSRNAQAQSATVPVEALTDDLQLGSLQMSQAIAGEALYLDGVVKNAGSFSVSGATLEVSFHDAQGKIAGSVQKPIMGMPHGGTDLVRNEFARNPIQPNEMRFFRVAVEQVPPTWNHEAPELKIVEVKVQ